MLLDNINSAPPEVVERLNSLMEDNPTLNVYEHADGEVLSYANKTMHFNFRLFVTANPRRPHSNKLSSAFYNRVIRMCLPPLDAGLTPATATGHDLVELLCGKWPRLPGGRELAQLCVRYHAEALELVASGKLRLLPDFRLTVRNAFQAADQAAHRLAAANASPVWAVVRGLARSYTSSVLCPAEQIAGLQALMGAVQHSAFRRSHYEPSRVRLGPVDDRAEAWELEAECVLEAAAAVERKAVELLWAALPLLDGMAGQAALALKVGEAHTANCSEDMRVWR